MMTSIFKGIWNIPRGRIIGIWHCDEFIGEELELANNKIFANGGERKTLYSSGEFRPRHLVSD